MEFTDNEKKILELMFSHMDDLIRFLEPYDFDTNDLFTLAEKLGIKY